MSRQKTVKQINKERAKIKVKANEALRQQAILLPDEQGDVSIFKGSIKEVNAISNLEYTQEERLEFSIRYC